MPSSTDLKLTHTKKKKVLIYASTLTHNANTQHTSLTSDRFDDVKAAGQEVAIVSARVGQPWHST